MIEEQLELLRPAAPLRDSFIAMLDDFRTHGEWQYRDEFEADMRRVLARGGALYYPVGALYLTGIKA